MEWIPTGGHIVYDGDCGLCKWIVNALKYLDFSKKLEFFPNNHPTTFDRFPELSLERSRLEILAHDPRSGWYGGYEACEWIALRIPLLWPLVPLTLIPGAGIAGNRLYNLVAKHRQKISEVCRLSPCRIPNGNG